MSRRAAASLAALCLGACQPLAALAQFVPPLAPYTRAILIDPVTGLPISPATGFSGGVSAIGPTGQVQYGINPGRGYSDAGLTVPITGFTDHANFKGTPANLYSIGGNAGAAEWVLCFDAAAVPAAGAVNPAKAWQLPAAGSWNADFGVIPRAFLTGLACAYSSTGPFTYTAVSAGINSLTADFQ